MVDLDNQLFHLMNGVWTNSVLDLLMPFLSQIGNDQEVWLVLLAALAILGGATGRWATVWASLTGLIALSVAYDISSLLKDVMMQPRPFQVLPDVRLLIHRPDSYGFPSGHATSAFAAACGAVLSYRRATSWLAWWAWGLLGLAAAVSYSRIYVGVHFPSDVLGGVVLGALVGGIAAILTGWLNERLWRTTKHREEKD